MRVYLVEQIDPDHVKRVAKRCKDMGCESSLEDLFWLPLPKTLLTEEQLEHDAECGPHSLALECGEDYLRLELLVRGRGPIRCSCIAYCTPAQREHMVNYFDNLLKELDIPA
ncbi:MAG: hypothetical protein LDL30_07345 [Desulfovibrio sp.]|nr:hypothetical protein [Desulfovibrio sp.]MCA1986479.1 hypothetical protein [Desulfovibrio sp.]